VAIGGLLGVFLIRKSEKANEHISKKSTILKKKRHFLQSPIFFLLPPILRMNGQKPQMKGHVEKKKVEGPPMLRMNGHGHKMNNHIEEKLEGH